MALITPLPGGVRVRLRHAYEGDRPELTVPLARSEICSPPLNRKRP